MNTNVKHHAQKELGNKKHQFNHVRIVTKDVLLVKMKLTLTVEFVKQITTYLKDLVSHVPHVN